MRQFQQLARMAEADGHLQQRIKQLLKLSKEKWDAACEHAKTAVQVCTLTAPKTITATYYSSSSCPHLCRCCSCKTLSNARHEQHPQKDEDSWELETMSHAYA